MEIWLPESYEGGDLTTDLETLVAKLRTLGPDFESVANMIESNPSAFVLWAFDSNVGEGGYLTNMNVTHEQVMSAVTLDMYVDAVRKQLPSAFTVTAQEEVQLGDYAAVRLVVDMDMNGLRVNELMYILKHGNTIWGITYATGISEFQERLPIFEQSAETFTLLP